ncbi:MAG: hypothetical protein ACK4PN_19195 [Allorhizobium sp.]
MFARFFKLGFALLLFGVLASCTFSGGRPIIRPLSYHVRAVTVLADARVPTSIVAGVDRRVSAAIAATRPPAGAERVVVLVKIDRLGYGYNARRNLRTARFTVTATSVETGEPVATGSFLVNNPTNDPMMAEESLAEEIASRVRFAFSLASPSLRKVVRPPRTQSTRLKTALAPEAPAVGAPAPIADEPAAAVLAPVPSAPAAGVVDTNVEEGASGVVKLGGEAPPVLPCDPVADKGCTAPKP